MNKGFHIHLLLLFYMCETVCSECQIAQVCVHDRTPDECMSPEVWTPGHTVFGCCPACVIPNDDTGGVDNEHCKPPANCLPDGTYAPVQCKGDQFIGRCFCTNENGTRIFGQMWRSDANEMTCACSRRRAELENSRKRAVTLHCTTSGDYEPLQCDDGICWCAEPKTGQPTVIPVPEADMTRLPCYEASHVGSQYLRQCESIVFARGIIAQEQSEHGTIFFGNPVTFCDYDGTYGPIQILNNVAACTGRDGKILGAWQVVTRLMAGMNCNCARDTMIHFPERGMIVTESCLGNGNYETRQDVGDVHYCVDEDGYPVECPFEPSPEQ